MPEFDGPRKHQNNPVCAKSVRVVKTLKLDTVRKKKTTLGWIRALRPYNQLSLWPWKHPSFGLRAARLRLILAVQGALATFDNLGNQSML